MVRVLLRQPLGLVQPVGGRGQPAKRQRRQIRMG